VAADCLLRQLRTQAINGSPSNITRHSAFSRIRFGPNDARGLISRSGHNGLPIAMQAQPK
jgi:hypothetical protein